ncbi:MAG: cobyrinate a,c-diamide synthase [Zetaproteobacteria bacterium]|nr:cobyrinate a,c-diamide synthase [Zetaproteobacteria bacterium]
MKHYLIAGTQSGCGKTTATLALMQHIRAWGKTVAPFKSGPDFLDPMWHDVACGRTSYNLDTRMIGVDMSRQLLAEKSMGADISIIEGVMGLFDGRSGVGGEGSSAHLAKELGLPVILVVSAKGMSGSLVALVEGFVARANHMHVQIVGIIANHVGSENHANILRELLQEFELPPLVAWLTKDAPQLPERHLGLKMPSELDLPDFSDVLHVEKCFISFLTTETQRHRETSNKNEQAHNRNASKREKITPENPSVPLCLCGELLKNKTIAISKDEAFCFIYTANIEWLEAQGAEVVYFSPLAGDEVPDHADALWLGGGYPELHLEALSQSKSLLSIRDFIENDKPVLAECGGMMVLGESILTTKARRRGVKGVTMSGLLPYHFIMQDKLAGLGYREDERGVRGHEFHHSKRMFTTEPQSHKALQEAFHVMRGDTGIRYKNLRASYIHWYFASQAQEVASWFKR